MHKHLLLLEAGKRTKTPDLHYSQPNGNQTAFNLFRPLLRLRPEDVGLCPVTITTATARADDVLVVVASVCISIYTTCCQKHPRPPRQVVWVTGSQCIFVVVYTYLELLRSSEMHANVWCNQPLFCSKMICRVVSKEENKLTKWNWNVDLEICCKFDQMLPMLSVANVARSLEPTEVSRVSSLHSLVILLVDIITFSETVNAFTFSRSSGEVPLYTSSTV